LKLKSAKLCGKLCENQREPFLFLLENQREPFLFLAENQREPFLFLAENQREPFILIIQFKYDLKKVLITRFFSSLFSIKIFKLSV
jgi:hypothetical protein